jgi:DNA recombination protein RmuC
MDSTITVLATAVVVALGVVLFHALRGLLRSGPDALSLHLAPLKDELARLARTQEELRRDVQRAREASLLQMAEAAEGLRADIGQAHRALAEVKALEQGRAGQMAWAAQSLRRLESIVAGSSTRGVAGENILARALSQLPPDLIAANVPFAGRVVEYALRLPGGRLLPIDSKWTSASVLERLEAADDPHERRRLVEQASRDVRSRIREMAKYISPERTLGLALLAVPDAVHSVTADAHAEGHREGVLVVPYSLALPYVLALYRLTARFATLEPSPAAGESLRTLEAALARADEEVEGRLSRALVQMENSRDALHDHVGAARRAAASLARAPGLGGPEPAALGADDLSLDLPAASAPALD